MNSNKLEEILQILVEISEGQCNLTDESILKEGDEQIQMIKMGLLQLHEDVLYERAKTKKDEIETKMVAGFTEENPNPVLRVDFDGIISYANPASVPVLLHIDRQKGEKVPGHWMKHVEEAKEAGMAKEFDIEEASRAYRILFAPFLDSGYINIYARDITREKELERELVDSERSKTVGAMVASYNHEIRNPLAIALGYLNGKREKLDEKRIAKIIKALDRIQEIVQKLDQISQGEVEFDDYAEGEAMLKMKKSA